MSLRQQNTTQLASLDDTITGTTRPHPASRPNPAINNQTTVPSASTLDPSASTFIPAPLSAPLPIRAPSLAWQHNNNDSISSNEGQSTERTTTTTLPLEGLIREGPMTPRNDAGPFVFDGSGGRRGQTVVDGETRVGVRDAAPAFGPSYPP